MELLTGEWVRLQEELTARLAQLSDGGRLRMGEPAKGGRGGLLKQRRSEPSRYVQFIAGPDVITAECVGSTNFGGNWSMSRDMEFELERRGWGWPPAGTSPHFRQHRRRAEAMWLAESAIEALQFLGAAPSQMRITDSLTEMTTVSR